MSGSEETARQAQERRAVRWIEPGFQSRYTTLLISVVLLVSSVLIGAFWFHSEQVLHTLMAEGVDKQHGLFVSVQKQMNHLLLSVVVVVVLFSAFLFVMANFFSHRVVGPLVAIKRSLELIGQHRFSEARIKLRADDEFQDVGELVNRTVDALERKNS